MRSVNVVNVFMNGGELAAQPIVYSGLSLEDLIGLPPTSNHLLVTKDIIGEHPQVS